MNYIDGMVCAVPTANKDIYVKHAKEAGGIFKEYGAIQCTDCWGDDVPNGELTSFPIAVQKKDDESVVFSWITWPSRKARDEGWAKIMEDPRMKPGAMEMPFDGKRLIYGGFEKIVET